MKLPLRRTTRLKLALIGIPLMECLLFVAAAMLLLFGGTLFSDAPEQAESAADAPGETVVTLDAKAPRESLTVSLSKNGVLRYAPVQQTGQTVSDPVKARVQDAAHPTVSALNDFSNGTLPIMRRDEDAVTLAKLLYGEARGVPSEAEKAAIVWCVLNRVDDPRFPDTVAEVVTARSQFAGYSPDHPVQSNLYLLAEDVLERWETGRRTGENDGRVLPKEYCYFFGDGKHNAFFTDLFLSEEWSFSSPDPYPALRKARMKKYYPSDREIDMIAKVISGVIEEGGAEERRAVAWCVMNRVSSSLFPDTVYEVITEKKQFPAYRETNPVSKSDVDAARAVAMQWYAEQNGAPEDEVDRLLPENYLYLDGNGRRNVFSKTYPVRYGYVFIDGRSFIKARW